MEFLNFSFVKIEGETVEFLPRQKREQGLERKSEGTFVEFLTKKFSFDSLKKGKFVSPLLSLLTFSLLHFSATLSWEFHIQPTYSDR